MNKPRLRTLGGAALLIALAVCGYWLLFTQFMVYDDEGYVLWSLRSYFAEGGLYSTVYSQYGPFLYALYDGLHRWTGLEFDNTTGRLLTLVYWLGTCALAAWFVWRQTRSALAAGGTAVLIFGTLLVMISEPIHPGGLLTLLAAIGAVGGAVAIERERHIAFSLLTGGIGAVMLLTKINVGAFFLIAAGSWLTIHCVQRHVARAGLWLTAVGSVLVPFALMQRLWPTPWVAIFALCFSCAALALLLLHRDQQRPLYGVTPWLGFVGAALLLAMTVLGLVWARGTSLSMLWFGVAVAPLQQPSAYAHAVVWPAVTPVLALGLALLAAFIHLRDWRWRPHVLAGLKLAAVGLLLSETPTAINNSLTFFALKYGLPFAWLMAVPLHRGARSPYLLARLWLAWVFVWQCLHAYPVAGSQVGWGACLAIPLAAAGATEALQFVAEQTGKWRDWFVRLGALIWVGGAALVLGVFGYVSHQRYTLGEPIGLHGAENLRLSDDITAGYRILDKNIRRHGDLLFSHPGMLSLNIWTERPTPTADNVTHWFSLLNAEQQQAIIERLDADPRAVVVAQSYLINYLVQKGYPPTGPLQKYLVRNFHAAFRINTFEFWIKNDRTIAPISIANITADNRLELVTAAIGTVATVEIRGLFYPYNRVAQFTPAPDGDWVMTPLNDDGTAAGESIRIEATGQLTGLNRMSLPIDPTQLPKRDLLEVVVLDPAGQKLDALLFDN
ncbi:MAG: hypothetical protein H7A44_03980 [Opitutaceae bacterium]|nr:hypothetical protein [Opitutaceae bacterium]